MPKYIVTIDMRSTLTAEIEAKDVEEATEIADYMNGADFTEIRCSWNITDVDQLP